MPKAEKEASDPSLNIREKDERIRIDGKSLQYDGMRKLSNRRMAIDLNILLARKGWQSRPMPAGFGSEAVSTCVESSGRRGYGKSSNEQNILTI
jgi:hypothetical protein